MIGDIIPRIQIQIIRDMELLLYLKNILSGIIINTGFNGWCSASQLNGLTGGFGGADSNKIKKITLNMFDHLLAHDNVFATPVVVGCQSPIACQDATRDQLQVLPNPSTGKYVVQS